MSGKRFIAVIDIGKTNAKLVLFDMQSRREIDVLTRPNAPLPGPPYRHFDVDSLWAFLKVSLAEIAGRHRIDALSITTHGACFALLGEDGALAMPVLDYEDTGPDSLAADYDRVRPPFAETGAARLPMGLNVGAQLYWQAQTFPDEFGRVRWIMPWPQYWAYRLTGVIASETTSLGVHTDLWNPYEKRYSSLVIEQGWERLMPEIQPASAVLGPVLPELARELGLPEELPVHSGIHDSNASLLPWLKSRPSPFAVLSTGTWVVILAVGARPVALDEHRDTLVNVNAFGDPVPSGRFMGGRAFDLLGANAKAVVTAQDRERVLRDSVMVLPSFPEGSGPYPGSKGRWTAEPSTPGERLFAVSLYLALMSHVTLDLIGAQGDVIIEGPFAANAYFAEMLGTLRRRRPVVSTSGQTGTSFGAALLAVDAGAQDAETTSSLSVEPDPALLAYAAEWSKRVDRG